MLTRIMRREVIVCLLTVLAVPGGSARVAKNDASQLPESVADFGTMRCGAATRTEIDTFLLLVKPSSTNSEIDLVSHRKRDHV
jgi:hypothetical protein